MRGGNLWELGPSGTLRQLTFTGDAWMPAVSPNHRQLVFARFYRRSSASDLWLYTFGTRREQALTRDINPLQVTKPDVRNNLWAAWPAWSSGGSSLLFSWDHAKLAQAPSDLRPASLALWSLPLSGSPAQLTTPVSGSPGDTEVAVRPHSEQYAYIRWSYYRQSFQPYSQLVLNDPVTGARTFLTPVGGRVIQPAWDPAGRRIVFVRHNPSHVDQIVVVPVLRTPRGPKLGLRTVIASGAVAQPAFTPDGRWISYLMPDGDGFAMYLAPAKGGQSTRVTGAGTSIDARSRPIWLP